MATSRASCYHWRKAYAYFSLPYTFRYIVVNACAFSRARATDDFSLDTETLEGHSQVPKKAYKCSVRAVASFTYGGHRHIRVIPIYMYIYLSDILAVLFSNTYNVASQVFQQKYDQALWLNTTKTLRTLSWCCILTLSKV